MIKKIFKRRIIGIIYDLFQLDELTSEYEFKRVVIRDVPNHNINDIVSVVGSYDNYIKKIKPIVKRIVKSLRCVTILSGLFPSISFDDILDKKSRDLVNTLISGFDTEQVDSIALKAAFSDLYKKLYKNGKI